MRLLYWDHDPDCTKVRTLLALKQIPLAQCGLEVLSGADPWCQALGWSHWSSAQRSQKASNGKTDSFCPQLSWSWLSKIDTPRSAAPPSVPSVG